LMFCLQGSPSNIFIAPETAGDSDIQSCR